MPEMVSDNVLSWAVDADEKVVEQASKTAGLPFVERPLALMADAHVGKGATIGSVIATSGAIIPAAVGVDVGCGVIAAKLTGTQEQLPDDLERLHTSIARLVPAGVGVESRGNAGRAVSAIVEGSPFNPDEVTVARKQLGTLGSGNHFVEVCADESGVVWVVIHSGSRGFGNKFATRFIETAKGLMAKYFIDLQDKDLAYLVEDTQQFDDYVKCMLSAQRYAAVNRETMMFNVISALCEVLGVDGAHDSIVDHTINCHHNYTEMEHHHGRNVWVTRKGAIRARSGDLGVIPGSMGTCSYVVEGLGNPASYCSSSHGAGRLMSRAEAKRRLDVDGLEQAMDGKVWDAKKAGKLIDEDPRAYKDIDAVMAAQSDLVKVHHKLVQLLNYKGT